MPKPKNWIDGIHLEHLLITLRVQSPNVLEERERKIEEIKSLIRKECGEEKVNSFSKGFVSGAIRVKGDPDSYFCKCVEVFKRLEGIK